MRDTVRVTALIAAVGATLVLVAGRLSGQSAPAADTLTTAEAKAHEGAVATVCGKVVSARYASSTRGEPTFLDLDKAYPESEFTVLIWGTDRPKFNKPESTLRDKLICVTGKIQAYQSRTEIIATDPKQITSK